MFVLISSFIVMNVVVGIVVNAISEVAEETKKFKLDEAEEKSQPNDEEKSPKKYPLSGSILRSLRSCLTRKKILCNTTCTLSEIQGGSFL